MNRVPLIYSVCKVLISILKCIVLEMCVYIYIYVCMYGFRLMEIMKKLRHLAQHTGATLYRGLALHDSIPL